MVGSGVRTALPRDSALSSAAGGPLTVQACTAEAAGFHVHLPVFSGPFDLLLSLISKHRLDVTEIALATVTDEFLAYLRLSGPEWQLEEATSFLVVATTLLDLKTAHLLPGPGQTEEEDFALLEARDMLFARLLQYRAYRAAAALIDELMVREVGRWPRAVQLEPRFLELEPEVQLSLSPSALAALAARVTCPRPDPEVSTEHVHAPRVSVREHQLRLRERLMALGAASFSVLSDDCTQTLEVVARFLALLELYREARVSFDQVSPLGELRVRWLSSPEPDQAAVQGSADSAGA